MIHPRPSNSAGRPVRFGGPTPAPRRVFPAPRARSFRPLFVVLGLALMVVLGRSSAAADGSVHPQDGPHVDLRIRLDDDRLRWQIGLNLAFMDEIVDVGREREDALDPVEERYLIEAVTDVLTRENRVVMDGVELEPTVTRFAFTRPDRTLLPLFPVSGMRGLIRAEILIDYAIPSEPRELTMTWARYPTDLLATQLEGGKTVPLAIEAQIQANGIIDLIRFSEPAPEVTWYCGTVTIAERMDPVPNPFEWGPAGAADAALASPTGEVQGDRADPGTNERPAAVPVTPSDAAIESPAAEPEAAPTFRATTSAAGSASSLPRHTVPALSAGFLGFAFLLLCTIPAVRRSGASRIFTYGSIIALVAAAVFVWPVAEPMVLPWNQPAPGTAARVTMANDVAADEASTTGPAEPAATPLPRPDTAAQNSDRAGADVSDAALLAVFEPTLTNVYRSFDYSEESDIYDALALSVQGPMLGDLYDRIYRSLVMEDHDRAVARVTDVVLLDAAVRSRGDDALDALEDASPLAADADLAAFDADDSFVISARWQVDGTVVHWGHAHARRQVYLANFALAPATGDGQRGWRIVDQRIFEQRRLPSPTDPLDMPAAPLLAPGDDI